MKLFDTLYRSDTWTTDFWNKVGFSRVAQRAGLDCNGMYFKIAA